MKALNSFIHQLTLEQLPEAVIQNACTCTLDLLGVGTAGHQTRLSKIMSDFVTAQMPGDIPLMFSDKTASLAGATLFGGMLIDSIDAHDGQALTKGHVGVAILPALLALAEQEELDGPEFITALVIGYEIATRAGIALHSTVTDYHTSGAWNCIAVAAVAARILKLSQRQTLEALGIAEFYGPRSQMMRCIDHPTMVKDGSGWGAHAGISAAILARSGFTGAPALTLAADNVESVWSDLGQRWYILEQYFKAYPVCRWAQPAVEAVRQIRHEETIDIEKIRAIHIYSFHEATRLHVKQPSTTEQAQYSLPYSVACALMDDIVTAEAIAETDFGLLNPGRLRLSNRVLTHEVDHYNGLFPAERWAHAVIEMEDGQLLQSAPCIARGNPENPLTSAEIKDKFFTLSRSGLSDRQANAIYQTSLRLKHLDNVQLRSWLQLLYRTE